MMSLQDIVNNVAFPKFLFMVFAIRMHRYCYLLGVSIASVARRLGHASMTTTQKTYLHIIQELENKDVDLIMRTYLDYKFKMIKEILTLNNYYLSC